MLSAAATIIALPWEPTLRLGWHDDKARVTETLNLDANKNTSAAVIASGLSQQELSANDEEENEDKASEKGAHGCPRRDIYFESKGIKCHAWLFMPKPCRSPDEEDPTRRAQGTQLFGQPVAPNCSVCRGPLDVCPSCIDPSAAPPVIVMAHGLGMQKDMKLPEFAALFAKAGYAVFLFDYRCFGLSEGQPRQLVSPWRHCEDYEEAIRHIKVTKGLFGQVNPERIILWGTSYSGGHALVTASKLGSTISAVVAMEPFLIGRELDLKRARDYSWTWVPRIIAASLSDILRRHLGLSRLYVPLVGHRGSGELFLSPSDGDEWEDYFNHLTAIGAKGGWQNLILASFIWEFLTYHPIDYVHKIQCPTLLVGGTKDVLVPASHVKRGAANMEGHRTEYLEFNAGHVGLYKEPLLVPKMIDFLNRVVPPCQQKNQNLGGHG